MVSANYTFLTPPVHPNSRSGIPVNVQITEDNISHSAKILFEKIILTKNESVPATLDLRGSAAFTVDERHTSWLHKLIYLGQLLNAFFTGKKKDTINLCHGEVILGVNSMPEKQGELLLAHSLPDGIQTTSEDHKKDEVITGVNIYRPIDDRMRNLFAKFAEQTAVNFEKVGIIPKSKNFKSQVKREVGQYSNKHLVCSVFHKQFTRSSKVLQRRAALAAADLLLKDRLRDERGNLASYTCNGYLLTLMQGTALVSALSVAEQKAFDGKTRKEIAEELALRIEKNQEGDHVAKTYWENEFMQADARLTMTYFAGEIFEKASVNWQV